MTKFLIIRFSSIGDIIQCMGIIGGIRERFADVEIHWITRKDMVGTLSMDGRIDKIWAFDKETGLAGLLKMAADLRKEHFDYIYDAHSNIRSNILKLIVSPLPFVKPYVALRSKERGKRFLLFKSQYVGICSILEHFIGERNFCFYLRMHPNLSQLDNPFVNDLLELADKFDNIIVIAPAEKISSYSLMNAADKVISFGSTMGVEANYWGKPSILLSASEYYNLGVCYLPSSIEELCEMIKADLQPLAKEGALKYAFYLLDREVRCHRANFVDISFIKRNMLFKTIYTFSYDKLLYSSFLARLESLLYRKLFSKFIPDKNKFPEQIVLDNI